MGFFENLNHSINVAAPLAIKMRQEAEERALREKIEEDRFKMQLQRFDAAAKRQEAQDALARIKTADTLGIPLTPDALTAAGLPVPQTPVSAEGILPGVDPAEYLRSRLPQGATVLNQEVIPGAQVPAMEGPINEMDRLYDQDLRSKINAGVFVPPPSAPQREAAKEAEKHRLTLEKIVLQEQERRETKGTPNAPRASSGRSPSGPSAPVVKPTKMSEADKILLNDKLITRDEIAKEIRKLAGTTNWLGGQKDPERLALLRTALATADKEILELAGKAAPAAAAPAPGKAPAPAAGKGDNWKNYLK